MSTIGTLDQDRYEIGLTDGGTTLLCGLPLSERSRFLMWFARFKFLWSAMKSLYPGGTFQAFYDAECIDEENKVISNPLHNSGLAWIVDHLLKSRNIPVDRIDADTAYALLVSYRGEPSVFDQLLVNYPRDPNGKPLPRNQDAELQFIGQMLSTGASSADIEWCKNHLPYRELQQALMMAQDVLSEDSDRPSPTPKNKPQPRGKQSPLNPFGESKEESKQQRDSRLTNCAQAFARDFGTDVQNSAGVEANIKRGKDKP